jgi:hypothetical protein
MLYNKRMKKMPKVFKSRGFLHKQVARTGTIAIYERKSAKGNNDLHWEVVKINKHNGYKLGGNYVSPAETYPSASMWGICGWTCNTLELAEQKYQELNKYYK